MSLSVTRWWWIRHAPVRINNGRLYGAQDLPCDVDDIEAFSYLSRYLPDAAQLLVSDLKRTHQTADALIEAGLSAHPAVIEPAIREQNFGQWQGRSYAEIQQDFGDHQHSFWPSLADYRPPGGESFVDLIRRVRPAIEKANKTYRDQDIIAVAHGGTIRAALAVGLDLSAEQALTFSIENLSLTRIDYIDGPDGGQWRIGMTNHLPHRPS